MKQPDWGMGTKKKWNTSCHGEQISEHTRELAPETDSCNRFAPGACFLILSQFDMRVQNSEAEVLLRNISFR